MQGQGLLVQLSHARLDRREGQVEVPKLLGPRNSFVGFVVGRSRHFNGDVLDVMERNNGFVVGRFRHFNGDVLDVMERNNGGDHFLWSLTTELYRDVFADVHAEKALRNDHGGDLAGKGFDYF